MQPESFRALFGQVIQTRLALIGKHALPQGSRSSLPLVMSVDFYAQELRRGSIPVCCSKFVDLRNALLREILLVDGCLLELIQPDGHDGDGVIGRNPAKPAKDPNWRLVASTRRTSTRLPVQQSLRSSFPRHHFDLTQSLQKITSINLSDVFGCVAFSPAGRGSRYFFVSSHPPARRERMAPRRNRCRCRSHPCRRSCGIWSICFATTSESVWGSSSPSGRECDSWRYFVVRSLISFLLFRGRLVHLFADQGFLRRDISAKTNEQLKFTSTTPPLWASATIISSVMLRGALSSARQLECDAKTGALETSSAS